MNKKIFFAIIVAVISLVSFSCSKEDRGGTSSDGRLEEDTTKILNVFTTPAGPEDDTRMTYSEAEEVDEITGKTTGFGINKTWEVGDELIGFVTETEEGKTVYKYFTYRCTKIENNEATWTRVADADSSCANTPSKTFDGALHMAFAPGVGAKGFRDDGEITLSGSILNQKDGEQMTIACGTGKIIDQGKMQIEFANQMALFSFRDITLNDIGSSTTVSEIEIDGVYTSATLGTIKTSEGKDSLVAVPAGNLGVVTYKPREGTTWTVSDKSGKKMLFPTTDGGKPLFLAVLPGSALNKMSIKVITADGPDYKYSISSSANIQAKPYRIKDKTLKSVSVAKIGSTEYTTIAAAMKDANEAGSATTVTLLDNCKIKTDLPAITNTNGVTLDLNGKTIITSGIKDVSQKRISVNNGGILTITDNSSGNVESQGSIVAADGTKGVSPVLADGGTLTINGGNIISNPANSDDIDAAVYGKNGATVIVTGGYIRGEGDEGALSVNSSTEGLTAEKVCSLTITGGKLEYSAGINSTLYIYRSNATISGGHILNSYTDKAGGAAITANNKDNTDVPVSVNVSGTANIEGNAQYGLRARYGMPVNISGGRISGRKPFTASGADHTVSGGELYNTTTGWDVLTVVDGAKIAVTGGKLYATSKSNLTSVSGTGSNVEFSGSVISNKPFLSHRVLKDYVLDRYTGTDDECLFCLAQEENSITATVDGGTYYCTPAGAQEYVNNSSSAVTLTVEKDFSSDRIYFKKGRENLITLDLKGHIISAADNDQKYLVTSSSSITIKDSSNPSTGAVTGVHSAVMVDSTATLTIAGGSFSGDGTYSGGSGVIYTPGTADSLKITGGTITCTGTSGVDSRAVNIGCDGIMTGGKIISKGSCLRMYTSNTKFTVSGDNTQIISDVGATTTMLVATATGSELRIKGGYYYISGPSTPGDSVAFQSSTARVLVQGGKMNVGSNKVTAAAGYKVSALDPSETFEGKTYTYKVEEDTEAEAKAQVNGTNYPSLSDAYKAAMAVSDSVTIKLLADATIIVRWDFNKQGAGTCLDLNGHNISTAVDSVFTPMKPLTITDSNSGTKGTITSSKFCVLALNSTAYTTVNINNCTITSTSTATSVGNSLIRSYNSSSTNASKRIINIGENAKLIANRNAIYACRGTVNISSNAEITANDNNSNASAIYVYTGGKVNVSDNASLKGYNVFRSGTSNTATAVTLNGGYFYAAGESGKIINFTSDYDAKFNFQGGYYNKAVNSTLYPKATIKAATTAITPVSHSHGGESLSYGYQIQ